MIGLIVIRRKNDMDVKTVLVIIVLILGGIALGMFIVDRI